MQPLRNIRSWKQQFNPLLGGVSETVGGGLLDSLFGGGLGLLSGLFGGGGTGGSGGGVNGSTLLGPEVPGGAGSINAGSVQGGAGGSGGFGLFGGGGGGGGGGGAAEANAQANNANPQTLTNYMPSLNLGSTFQVPPINMPAYQIPLQGSASVVGTPPAGYSPPAPISDPLETFAALSRSGGGGSAIPFLGGAPAQAPQLGPAQAQMPQQGGVGQAQPQQQQQAPAPFQGNIPPTQMPPVSPSPFQLAQQNPQSIVAANPNVPIWQQVAQQAQAQRAQNNAGPSAPARAPIQGKATQRHATQKQSQLVPPPPPNVDAMLNGTPASVADDLVPELKPEVPALDLSEGVKSPSKEMNAFLNSREAREKRAIQQIPDLRQEKGKRLQEAEAHQKAIQSTIETGLTPELESEIRERAYENFDDNNPRPTRPSSLSRRPITAADRIDAAAEGLGEGLHGALPRMVAGLITGRPVQNRAQQYVQGLQNKADQAEYMEELRQWGRYREDAAKSAVAAAERRLPLAERAANHRVQAAQKDAALADKDYQAGVNQAKRGVYHDMMQEFHAVDQDIRNRSLEARIAHQKVGERLATWGRQLQAEGLKLQAERNEIAGRTATVAEEREARIEEEEPVLEAERKSKTAANWGLALQNLSKDQAVGNLVKAGMTPEQAEKAAEAMLGAQ